MQLVSKLRRLDRIQRITLVLFIVAVLNYVLLATSGYQIFGGDLLAFLLCISVVVLIIRALRPLTRRLLWRLRNRLIVTYILFGVVPLVLILVMLALSVAVLFGQIASNMVREELDRQADLNLATAHDLAMNALFAMRAGTAGAAAEFVKDVQTRMPRLHAVIQSGGSRTPIAGTDIDEIPAWAGSGFKGVVEKNGAFLLAAKTHAESAGKAVDVFAYTPLDDEALADLTRTIGSVNLVNVNLGSGEFRANARKDSRPRRERNPDVRVNTGAGLPAARGLWDFRFGWASPFRATTWEGARGNFIMTVTSRPSLIFARLFANLGTIATALGAALFAVLTVFIFVEIVSLIWSINLTRSITRAVHDIYFGTKRVEAGDLSHRIPIRKKDQLGDLARSFNSMTAHVQRLVEEVKEKEKLESELEIAREVQAQLFPKGVPHLETLELAGICKPARIVSGDYYDFVALNSRWTAIVIGDISGKGISAALLMASLQSSLHAQLTAVAVSSTAGSAGNDEPIPPSPALLVTRLNRQLFESTSAEKCATFYCAMYDDRSGVLSYTNAGHLPPMLIREGKLSRLEVNGMVVGILPDTPYEQNALELKRGDLLAAFTDGITESENPHGEQYGEDRLAGLLVANADRPLEDIVQITTASVRSWTGDSENQDDTTMLLARRL